jgi:hypothetical protein
VRPVVVLLARTYEDGRRHVLEHGLTDVRLVSTSAPVSHCQRLAVWKLITAPGAKQGSHWHEVHAALQAAIRKTWNPEPLHEVWDPTPSRQKARA